MDDKAKYLKVHLHQIFARQKTKRYKKEKQKKNTELNKFEVSLLEILKFIKILI